jgi:CHAD domain-containing protein
MKSRAIDIRRFIRRLFREQYGILLNAEPGARAGRIESLHDMRVAIRRLRNLFKAFRNAWPRREADALEARFRLFSKQLGPARDMAEFFAATLDRPVARLARRLKAAQDVLGDIHDCDICLARARRAKNRPPPGLVGELNRRRRTHVARFGEVWNRLNIKETRSRS